MGQPTGAEGPGPGARERLRLLKAKPRPSLKVLLLGAVVSTIVAAGMLSFLALRESGTGAEPDATYTLGHVAMLKTLNGRLPFEPRLSGMSGLEESPSEKTTGSFLSFAGPGVEARLTAEAQIERDVAEDSSPETLAARGVAHLLQDSANEAIAALERARLGSPDDPRILTDLAAAHLVRATDDGRPEDLIRALDLSWRAKVLDPQMLEARFNHALSLQSLFLSTAARAAWEEYLDLEASPEWVSRAHRYLAEHERPSSGEGWEDASRELLSAADEGNTSLVARLVSRFPKEARELVEESVLGSWALAVLAGEVSSTANHLSRALQISTALVQGNHDHMLADALAVIEDVPAERSPAVVELAQAHSAFSRARALYAQHREAEAWSLFEKGRIGLERAGSPLADWCAFYLAVGQYQRSETREALASLDALDRKLKHRGYPSLQGRIHWMRGMALLARGEPAASLNAYGKALEIFQTARLETEQGSLHTLLAQNYSYLGERDRAWRHRYWALSGSLSLVDPGRLELVFIETADSLASDYPNLAMLYYDEIVALVTAHSDPLGLAHALLRRGSAYLDLGGLDRAKADFGEVSRLISRVPGRAQRRDLEAALARAEGTAWVSQDPGRAVRALSRALALQKEAEREFDSPRLLLERARALFALDDLAGADADLRRAIGEHRRQGDMIQPLDLRLEFTEQSRSLSREMVRLQLARGRPDEGLRFADWQRENVFDWTDLVERRDAVSPNLSPRAALASRESQERVPDGVALVEYAVLEDRLIAWTLASGVFHFAEDLIEERKLAEMVESLRSDLVADSSSRQLPPAHASDLFELLVRPALSAVSEIHTLVLVPDGPLYDLPFAALVDASTGRFLVEDYVLVVAPSARSFLAYQGGELGQNPGVDGPALVLGNPRSFAWHGLRLPALDYAEREAFGIVGHLPGSRVLTRQAATREIFVTEAGDFPIVHLATHAVSNQDYPLLSYLVLAGDDQEASGIVYAHELGTIPFRRTRLVVLSACSTVGHRRSVEMDLTSAFLAAGVPAVVGTLWPLDDLDASELFEEFYEALSDGASPAQALRAAQLSLLRSGGASGFAGWAVVRVTGFST